MSENKTQKELDFERKHEQDLQRLRGLRLIDDDFMAAVFEDPACAEFLLQIILKRADLKVREVHGQYSIKNLQGRSVRLDILAVDEQNRAYNIEVQRSDRGASEKRARYNSSLLDANLTYSGSSYDALNETYVIFITENDVLKAGLPIYHIHRMVEETGAVFNDQSHIIYPDTGWCGCSSRDGHGRCRPQTSAGTGCFPVPCGASWTWAAFCRPYSFSETESRVSSPFISSA